jgi:hypothetical protein
LLGQWLDSLDSAQAGHGEGTRPARGEKRRAGVGCRLRWAELGQKQRREKNSFSFSFHNHFKEFSNEILNPLLNFQIEHTIQNIM